MIIADYRSKEPTYHILKELSIHKFPLNRVFSVTHYMIYIYIYIYMHVCMYSSSLHSFFRALILFFVVGIGGAFWGEFHRRRSFFWPRILSNFSRCKICTTWQAMCNTPAVLLWSCRNTRCNVSSCLPLLQSLCSFFCGRGSSSLRHLLSTGFFYDRPRCDPMMTLHLILVLLSCLIFLFLEANRF